MTRQPDQYDNQQHYRETGQYACQVDVYFLRHIRLLLLYQQQNKITNRKTDISYKLEDTESYGYGTSLASALTIELPEIRANNFIEDIDIQVDDQELLTMKALYYELSAYKQIK